jgi:hypothetical protein
MSAGTDTPGSRTIPSWYAFLHARKPATLIRLVPFAIAAAYLVVFLLQLRHNLVAFTWNSDVASAFTIPQTLIKTGTGGHTVLASTGSYIPLWFGLLTASLPLHRELWELAAPATFLMAALVIGWSVSQVATRRAAGLAVLLALMVSPLALAIFMSAAFHNTVYLGTALLGAYVVWMTRAQPQRRVITFVVPPLAGVLLGVCFASDLLLLVTGIVPFAFTAVLAGIQRNQRSRMLAISAFSSIVVAAPVAWITSEIMGSTGFVIVRPPTETAPLSALSQHSEYLFEGLKELFGGYLGSQRAPGTPQAILGIASNVIMAAALIALLIFGIRTVAKLIMSSWHRHGEEATPRELATAFHVVYWTGSAASTAAAFELSVKADGVHPQYYITLIFSVAAVIPLLLLRPASIGARMVPIYASIFFAAGLVGLMSIDPSGGQQEQNEPEITRLAEANHATTGYAGYWYASDLTWNSRERVKVRPVELCENPTGANICPFYLNRVPSWYAPAQRRTFLLVNPTEEYLSGVPKGLGPPLVSYAIDETTRMYVYPYDIASRLGRPYD